MSVFELIIIILFNIIYGYKIFELERDDKKNTLYLFIEVIISMLFLNIAAYLLVTVLLYIPELLGMLF